MSLPDTVKRLPWYVWLILTVAAVILGHYLLSSSQRLVSHVIENAISGVETENVGQCLEAISETYLDDYGYRRKELKEMAQDAFAELDDIRVSILNQEILIKDSKAFVELEVRVVASVTSLNGQRGYIFGDFNHPENVHIELENDNGKWMIVKISNLPNRRD
ncbi:hypothetical protein JW979_01105 [bacterium]|nr:hypothetical protein [candidate division CSSED10-310 bacterium]